MEEKLKQTQFEKANAPNPFNAPIPGESLTSSPDMQKAWERPPQYTNADDCMEEIYMEMTNEENLMKVVNLIDEGTPLDEMAQVILYKGYTEGLWNPDLMLSLIEPTIYILINIADYAEIKDYTLYEGEDTDPDGQIPDDDVEPIELKQNTLYKINTEGLHIEEFDISFSQIKTMPKFVPRYTYKEILNGRENDKQGKLFN